MRALLTQLERIEVSLNKLMYYVMYLTYIVIPVKTTFKLLVDNFLNHIFLIMNEFKILPN